MTFKVFFDANVLVPATLNDIILNLASAELFKPLWSDQIFGEVERTLQNKIGMSQDAIQRRLAQMNSSFPEAKVENYQELTTGITCTDPKDSHVLAAAIIGSAGALVTFNLKDFPSDLFELHGLDLEHPDDFLAGQFDLDSSTCAAQMALLLKRWDRPSLTLAELITTIQESLPLFSAELEKNGAAVDFHLALNSSA